MSACRSEAVLGFETPTVRRIMPYSDSDSLNVFLSYASEDEKISEALARTLRAAFVDAIEITMMSEFPSGLNWRRLVDESIAETDILIAIATGQIKPSHSFTGQEIGSFSFSTRSQPKMARFNSLDRRMIPFAVLPHMPDTMNEFEGIDIDPGNLCAVRFDAINFEENVNNLYDEDEKDAPDRMLFKLLGDIEDIINQARPTSTSAMMTKIEQRATILKGHARSLCKEIFENMRCREKSVIQPKSKLIIDVPPTWQRVSKYELVENATLRIEGPCYDAFGLSDAPGRKYKWADFASNAEDDIVFGWREALAQLISPAQRADFIDNSIILSFDRKRIFRVFTSRIALFYSNEAQFHIYVVEMLRHKDHGDPLTTLLLRALQVSLGYRFMFLEYSSEFSPTMFMATNVRDLKRRVLDLINGLNLLLQTTEEYQLNDPKTIIGVLGISASKYANEMYKSWDIERTGLYEAAKSILRKKECGIADKIEFIEVLKSFCDRTRGMNMNYTGSVLKLLHDKINADGTTKRARNSRGGKNIKSTRKSKESKKER
jgi:hypothetical protein